MTYNGSAMPKSSIIDEGDISHGIMEPIRQRRAESDGGNALLYAIPPFNGQARY